MIWTVIKPSHLLVLLALAAIVTFRRSSGRRLLLLVAFAFVVVTVLPVAAWLTAPLEQRFAAPPAGAVPDGIVVLAGAEAAALTTDYGDAQWHEGAARLTTFVMLAHRFPEARLVHSGSGKAKRPGDLSQSEVAREFVLGAGIEPARVVFEDTSSDTCNSPAAVIDAVTPSQDEQWWLVTSAFHMPRSIACYRAAGWNV
ncbi:MAG: YdcF family protein, partial [Pseudomonadota bacterium]